MDASFERQFRLMRVYGIVSAVAIAALTVAVWRSGHSAPTLRELNVERLNVVEPDGRLRVVIANRQRSPGPIFRGVPFGGHGGERPGMVFYNDEGTENGGLTLVGRHDSSGYHAVSHLAFDQFDQDQVLYLQYSDDNGKRLVGLTVADRADENIAEWARQMDSVRQLADGPAKTRSLERLTGSLNGTPRFARRVFVGRERSQSAAIELGDRSGKTRLRLSVDSSGSASIEFLDPQGRVTYRLPGVGHR
jgi:hypothetical protein